MSPCILHGLAGIICSNCEERCLTVSQMWHLRLRKGNVICPRSPGGSLAEPGFELASPRPEFELLATNDTSQPPSPAPSLDQQHPCHLGAQIAALSPTQDPVRICNLARAGVVFVHSPLRSLKFREVKQHHEAAGGHGVPTCWFYHFFPEQASPLLGLSTSPEMLRACQQRTESNGRGSLPGRTSGCTDGFAMLLLNKPLQRLRQSHTPR